MSLRSMVRRDDRSVVLDAALVRAALWQGPDAVEAWRRRPGDFDLDEIWNPERHRLLGRIGRNLAEAGCDDVELPRLTGIARKQWVEHQIAATRLAPLVTALDDAGVPVWLVGGGAIGRASWGCDGQLGSRSSDDTRLMVRHSDAVEAIAALTGLGLRFPPPPRVRRRIEWFTSVGMQFGDGTWSELSWSPSTFVSPPGELAAGETVDFGGATVRLLSPELTLVQVCADSAWSTERRGLSWLLDADRLLGEGKCDVAVASQMAAELGLGDVVDRRVAVYRLARDAHSGTGWLADCPVALTGWERLFADVRAFGPGRSRVSRLRGIGEFLADRWFLDSARCLPAAAVRRAWFRARRLGRRGE